MQNEHTVTIGGKTISVDDYIDSQSGRRIERGMSAFKQNMLKNTRSGAHSLANFIPIRKTTMDKEKKPSLIYLMFKLMLTTPGKKYDLAAFVEAINRQKNSVSVYTSKLRMYIEGSGEVDDIYKFDNSSKKTTFWCIAKSVDNPSIWAERHYKSFLEFERVRLSIVNEKRALKRLGGQTPKPQQQHKLKPDTISQTPMDATPVNYNGSPVDVPIRISITVAVNFEKE